MSTVLITGGTGLVGKALGQALLEKGYRVIILTRNAARVSTVPGLSYAAWDPEQQTIDERVFQDADYIVHLAGASVAEKRWTQKRKKEILSSRVQGSGLIVKSLANIPNKVKAVISASAIGWYGPDPAKQLAAGFSEDMPAATDFLGTTCRQWEESIRPVEALGKRLAILRIGIVLSRDGGAMKEFLKPLKWGIAPVLGNGKQIISWIHINDLIQLFIWAIGGEQIKGVFNAVAPAPVSNRKMITCLAKSRRKFSITIPVPSWLLRWMLGEMSTEVLKSARVSSVKIRETGFVFNYSTMEKAADSFFPEHRS